MDKPSSFFTHPNFIIYLRGLEHGGKCMVIQSLYNTFSRHLFKEKRFSKGRRLQSQCSQRSGQKPTDLFYAILQRLLLFQRLNVCKDRYLSDKIISQQMFHALVNISLSGVLHHTDLSVLKVLTKLKHVHLYFHKSPRDGIITVIIDDLANVLPNSIHTLSLMNITIVTNVFMVTNTSFTHSNFPKPNTLMHILTMLSTIYFSSLLLPLRYVLRNK